MHCRYPNFLLASVATTCSKTREYCSTSSCKRTTTSFEMPISPGSGSSGASCLRTFQCACRRTAEAVRREEVPAIARLDARERQRTARVRDRQVLHRDVLALVQHAAADRRLERRDQAEAETSVCSRCVTNSSLRSRSYSGAARARQTLGTRRRSYRYPSPLIFSRADRPRRAPSLTWKTRRSSPRERLLGPGASVAPRRRVRRRSGPLLAARPSTRGEEAAREQLTHRSPVVEHVHAPVLPDDLRREYLALGDAVRRAGSCPAPPNARGDRRRALAPAVEVARLEDRRHAVDGFPFHAGHTVALNARAVSASTFDMILLSPSSCPCARAPRRRNRYT